MRAPLSAEPAARNDYPKNEYQKNDYPKNDYPKNDYQTKGGGDGPRSELPRHESWRTDGAKGEARAFAPVGLGEYLADRFGLSPSAFAVQVARRTDGRSAPRARARARACASCVPVRVRACVSE
jgi:hypothetical protein